MRFLELKKIIDDNIKKYKVYVSLDGSYKMYNFGTGPFREQNFYSLQKAILTINKYTPILNETEYQFVQEISRLNNDDVRRVELFTQLFQRLDVLVKTLNSIQNTLNLKEQEEGDINFKLPEGVDVYEKIEAINKFKEKFNTAFSGSLEMRYKKIDCGSDWLVYTIVSPVVGVLVSKPTEALVMLIFSKVKQKYLNHKEKQKAMQKEACYSPETKKSMEKDEQKFLEEKLNETAQDIIDFCEKTVINILNGTKDTDSSKETIIKTILKLAIAILEEQNIEVHPSLNPPKYLDENGYVEMEELNKIIKSEQPKITKEKEKPQIEHKQETEEKDEEE